MQDKLTGTLLDGKYRVGKPIGAGGIGVVYAAEHVQLGVPCAVKVLHTGRRDEKSRQRLVREGRALAQMAGTHAVQVCDVGALSDGSPYIVMELLHGETIAARLQASGPLEPRLAVRVACRVCEVLQIAHQRGLVHCDIKPSNLFLVEALPKLEVKVLDFGLAKSTSTEVDDSLATASDFAGSPRYMSPEQIRASSSVDHRTDLWSLAVTLFEMLCGRTPFEGETNAALLASITSDPPARLKEAWPDAPARLDHLLALCLEKHPQARPDGAASVQRSLLELLADCPEAPASSRTLRRTLDEVGRRMWMRKRKGDERSAGCDQSWRRRDSTLA